MESVIAESTEVVKIMGDELMVAKVEFTSEAPASPVTSKGKQRVHCQHTYLKLNTKEYFNCMMVS